MTRVRHRQAFVADTMNAPLLGICSLKMAHHGAFFYIPASWPPKDPHCHAYPSAKLGVVFPV